MALQSIMAAATRIITRKGGKAAAGGASGLQSLAWDMYETVPEVGAFADYIGNAMSGARLFAGRRMPDGTVEPAPDGSRAAELVRSMAGGAAGQSMVLADFGTGLAVAGEVWAVIVPDTGSDSIADDKWYVLSTDEVKVQRGRIKATIEGEEVDIPEYDPDAVPAPGTPVYFRVWKRSPRRQWNATSPVIRSLAVLEELRLLNAAVAAVARSRITGRGVLLVPAGTRFPGPPQQDGQDDDLLDTFIEVASTAIREPESAAATVPIVLEVPGDLVGGVKWVQFTSDFDTLAIKLREEAVRRFATGADVPAEVLLGLGDTNHWGAWALTAEALRLGVEPRLALVCDSLTNEWLRPLLEEDGVPQAGEWVVWYDTSSLRSSSNKGPLAIEAHKEGLISDAAGRRELGFTETDAPGTSDAGAPPAPPRPEEGTVPVDAVQQPPADTALTAAADVVSAQLAAGLTAAMDGVVWSALAVAGQKIMRTPICPRPERSAARELMDGPGVHTRYPVSPGDVTGYRLLEGAWVRVPELAARYGVDSATLVAALRGYCEALLSTGTRHTQDDVVRMLAQAGILPSTLIGMSAKRPGGA